MNLESSIIDSLDREWLVIVKASGRVIYENGYTRQGVRDGWMVENFKITDITLVYKESVLNLNSMDDIPDVFNQEEIKELEQSLCDDYIDEMTYEPNN